LHTQQSVEARASYQSLQVRGRLKMGGPDITTVVKEKYGEAALRVKGGGDPR
jgi:hypothetical protein